MRCGWTGTVSAFMVESPGDWLASLTKHYQSVTNELPASTQVRAWRDCFDVLRSQFAGLGQSRPDSVHWALIFEYELPREGGRRPDLVLLGKDTVVVVEFKEKAAPTHADVDQVSAYAKDLLSYHEGSQGKAVHALLVATKAVGEVEDANTCHIVPPGHLSGVLAKLVPVTTAKDLHTEAWINAAYAPLPFLVEAARHIFRHDPLPYIKRAHAEAQIPKVIDYLVKVAERARQSGERHMALVTGVPGAGKTLVGLQFVYEHAFGASRQGDKPAVFLSGNGPLVEVLRHALKSGVFVQPMRNFIKEYGIHGGSPKEQIIVFDEAQRAWSQQRVLEKHGENRSEPDLLIDVCERTGTWSLLVGLVGEGQEIHIGEEAGMEQWDTAIAKGRERWYVHAPSSLKRKFPSASTFSVEPLLSLTTSLRTHVASDVQEWVRFLLEGEIDLCQPLAQKMSREGFHLYVTRSLDEAKNYARERYHGEPTKRYGLLASSKPGDSILDKLGAPRDYMSKRSFKVGSWYNDNSSSPLSCCQFTAVATEFECQGLELDLPIVCWSNDLWWQNQRWASARSRSQAENPHQLRLNSYRVLLSRGRDGCVIWVPEHRLLDDTYSVLLRAGAIRLDEAPVALHREVLIG